MSRRTFEALAAQLRLVRPKGAPSDISVQWCKDIAAVAQALASTNAAFDPKRFVNDVLNARHPE